MVARSKFVVEWDNDCISLFRDLNPTRWTQLNSNPISLLSEMPLPEIERRARELVLHSRITYAYRRQQEYLHADRTWGAKHAGVLRPRASGILIGRIRTPRIHPHLLGRPRSCVWAITLKAHPIWTFRWSGSGCSTGKDNFSSASMSTGGSGKNISRSTSSRCRWSRRSAGTANR